MRVGLGLLVVACTGVGVLGVIAANESVTYYLTPTEAVASPDRTGMRVGGLVVTGSIDETAEQSSLVITDGTTDLTVLYEGRVPDVILEGQGAVVEGRFTAGGDFVGTAIVMRHSNEYRAPDGGS